MHRKERIKQDLIKIVDLTEYDHRVADTEWEYGLQMNIDHYFDKRMPPWDGNIFKDIKCLWSKEENNGSEGTQEV